MANKNYYYVAENLGADALEDSIMFPGSSVLGIEASDIYKSKLFLKPLGENTGDFIEFVHTSGGHAEFCEAMAIVLNSDPNGGEMIVLVDEDNGITHPVLKEYGVTGAFINIDL